MRGPFPVNVTMKDSPRRCKDATPQSAEYMTQKYCSYGRATINQLAIDVRNSSDGESRHIDKRLAAISQ